MLTFVNLITLLYGGRIMNTGIIIVGGIAIISEVSVAVNNYKSGCSYIPTPIAIGQTIGDAIKAKGNMNDLYKASAKRSLKRIKNPRKFNEYCSKMTSKSMQKFGFINTDLYDIPKDAYGNPDYYGVLEYMAEYGFEYSFNEAYEF